MILATAIAGSIYFAKQHEPRFAEMVVLMDISGSTFFQQEAIRGYLMEKTNGLIRHYGPGRFRCALVLYGMGPSRAMVSKFTADPDTILSYLSRDIVAEGGYEQHTDVSIAALNDVSWSKGKEVNRMMVVIGNEPPEQGSASINDTVLLAKADKISISTVYVTTLKDPAVQAAWEDWAKQGGGTFKALSSREVLAYTQLYRGVRAHARAEFVRQETFRAQEERKAKILNDLMHKKNGGG